jgi:hypothetical protein
MLEGHRGVAKQYFADKTGVPYQATIVHAGLKFPDSCCGLLRVLAEEKGVEDEGVLEVVGVVIYAVDLHGRERG